MRSFLFLLSTRWSCVGNTHCCTALVVQFLGGVPARFRRPIPYGSPDGVGVSGVHEMPPIAGEPREVVLVRLPVLHAVLMCLFPGRNILLFTAQPYVPGADCCAAES